MCMRRLRSELRNYNLEKSQDDTIRIEVVSEDLLKWKGFIQGVPGTPYEGGTYELEIKFGETYPYTAPSIKFVTKIWHPAVSPFDGTICLPDREEHSWPVPMTIYKTLLSIQSWMGTIHAQDPIEPQILKQALLKPEMFAKTAEFWAIRFAGARRPYNRDYQMKVQLLTQYTRKEERAIIALSFHDWTLPENDASSSTTATTSATPAPAPQQ